MADSPRRVLFVTPEVLPYSKTGGLAEVASSLPPALSDLGLEVRVISPLYRSVREYYQQLNETEPLVSRGSVVVPTQHGQALRLGRIWHEKASVHQGAPAQLFVENDRFFDRPNLYGTPDEDYRDNLHRFSFFSLAALATIRTLDWIPDIIHLNDWQTSLAALYLRQHLQAEEDLQWSALVLTIHNLGYQGVFPKSDLRVANISEDLFHPQALEFYGKLNLLKAGILYADVLNTVSTTYAQEIQTKEFGCGLDGVLKTRSDHVYGILNGVDYETWNPADDPFIAANYSPDDLSGKRGCKRDLLEQFGLPSDLETPLIAVMNRLVEQKGTELFLSAIDELMREPVSLVVLGSGEERFEKQLRTAAQRYPERIGVKIDFSDELAHKVEAGADIFLIPSKQEPCGLNQFYSLRYGTVPVVRATGGLEDSIEAYDWDSDTGIGFKFNEATSSALVWKIREALQLYRKPEKFRSLQKRMMTIQHTWESAAERYRWLYNKAMEATRH